MSAVPENLFGSAANDSDAQETREWIDALAAVIANSSTHDEGRARAHFLLEQLLEQARQEGVDLPFSATTLPMPSSRFRMITRLSSRMGSKARVLGFSWATCTPCSQR